jgi:hypothetical protein
MARDSHSRTLGEGQTVASSPGALESDLVADGETIGAAAARGLEPKPDENRTTDG